MSHLFCFGLGYTALTLAKNLLPQGWRVSGTCRSMEKCLELQPLGITAYTMDEVLPLLYPADYLRGVTHIITSIPPTVEGDSVLRHHAEDIRRLPGLEWIGYLSTTGVYGDHQGSWVDETTPVNPPNARSVRRVEAEAAWLASGLPVHIFRLSGIYGPGRSAIDDLREGTARRIDKPGQVFSRIHVEDIAQILTASMAAPNPGAIYNCADDEPAPQAEVVAYAAKLLDITPPPLVPFEQAELSEMARSFYASNRRVANRRVKEELKVTLRYPSYREGLSSILSAFQERK